MKKNYILSLLSLLVALSGCIVDVADQSSEQTTTSTANGISSAYIDASGYRESLSVEGNSGNTLMADGQFSLWATSASSAASITKNVHLYWGVDTLSKSPRNLQAHLFSYSDGPQKELVLINKMTAKIPAQENLTVTAGSTDVSIQSMNGDITVGGAESNINFANAGRMNITTTSGTITGKSGLGGLVQSTSGDINITITNSGFYDLNVSTSSSGNVTIHVPAGIGITLLLASPHGNCNLNYDGVIMNSTTGGISTNLHGGGRKLQVATSTGSITVTN
jgi:hypothetical protein